MRARNPWASPAFTAWEATESTAWTAYLAAVATAEGNWTAAESAAWSAFETARDAALQNYQSTFQNLQAQADQAWSNYSAAGGATAAPVVLAQATFASPQRQSAPSPSTNSGTNAGQSSTSNFAGENGDQSGQNNSSGNNADAAKRRAKDREQMKLMRNQVLLETTGSNKAARDANQTMMDVNREVPIAAAKTAALVIITAIPGPADDYALKLYQMSKAAKAPAGQAARIAKLTAMAKKLYNKTGTENHHIIPIFLGGARNGLTVSLDANYHQLITNEFRALGKRFYGTKLIPTPQELADIMKKVYSKYPLPLTP